MSIKRPKLEEIINKLGQDEFLVGQGYEAGSPRPTLISG